MTKDRIQDHNPAQRNQAQNNRGGEEKIQSQKPNKSLEKSAANKSGKHTADR